MNMTCIVENISDEQVLLRAGVHITALRLMVLHNVRANFHDAFSLADLEQLLPTVDRSTLFRTLGIFTDHRLLHEIDDGTGTQKYCVCAHGDTNHCNGHVHITCRVCNRTFCLTSVTIPAVPLPDGFLAEDAEYVVKGVCPACQQRDNAKN